MIEEKKNRLNTDLSTIWFIRYIQRYVHSTVYKSARDPAVSIEHANRNVILSGCKAKISTLHMTNVGYITHNSEMTLGYWFTLLIGTKKKKKLCPK